MQLLELLNADEKKLFKTRTYQANSMVKNEGDICDHLGIVIDGEINISTYTYNEKKENITMLASGELFGQFLIFNESNIYLGSAIANKKTTMAFISKDNLLKLFQSNEEFLKTYLEIICTESIRNKNQSKMLAHKNIRDRIMYYFENIAKNKVVNIKNVTNLSAIISLPRPSVSRELSKMEKDGVIKRVNSKTFILK